MYSEVFFYSYYVITHPLTISALTDISLFTLYAQNAYLYHQCCHCFFFFTRPEVFLFCLNIWGLLTLVKFLKYMLY